MTVNQASLEEVLATIKKACGTDTIRIGVPVVDISRLQLPARALTRSWYGGLPFGRIIEFSGAEHSGKTTTALLAIASYQKTPKCKKAVFIDVEGGYDAIWASKLGVDNSKLILFVPEDQTAEEILQYVLDLISTGEVGIIVLDSIPALVPQNESEKRMGEMTMGGISAPLTVFTRKLTRVLNKYRHTIFIGINQLRENMTSYGSPTKTTGGRMFRHGASLRIEFRGYNIDENFKSLPQSAENVSGSLIQAFVLKNKTAPRDIKLGQYYVLFSSGFNEVRDVFDYALTEGIITQAGSVFRYVASDGQEYKKAGSKNFICDIPKDIWEDLQKTVDEYTRKALEREVNDAKASRV
jgi:recombination protein RecA